MRPQRSLSFGFLFSGAAWLSLAGLAPAQNPAPAPGTRVVSVVRPDLAVQQALMANPYLAPYRIVTSMSGGRVVLSGKVGTKQLHDLAIRTAIAVGYSFDDNLVIDTGAAHLVAAMGAVGPGPMSGMGPVQGGAPGLGSQPYIYPQPLFGRLDDPFYGFEPPLVSYPPWYGAVQSREPINVSGLNGAGPVGGPMPMAPGPAVSSAPGSVPMRASANDAVVEMTIDPRGVATLRGTVPNLAVRIAVGQRIAQTAGVSEVINLLEVGQAPAGAPVGVSDVPPPPPVPAVGPFNSRKPPPTPRPGVDEPENHPGVAIDAGDLTDRLSAAFVNRPALAGLPIRVSVRDGVATLAGKVPTVYEAMLAYRAVQQAPGVREVVDRLQFTVPDGERQNPLRLKGRPDDVEPYLDAQIRRQVGDLAHVDQVRLRGDALEIRGTLLRAEDKPRLDAILRSMPVLRGFRLDSTFVPQ